MSGKDSDYGEGQAEKSTGRRQFLQLAGSGLGVGLLTNVTQATSIKDVRVPRSISADGIERWMKVPKSWLEHYRHVKQVKEDFAKDLLSEDGVLEISMTSADKNSVV